VSETLEHTARRIAERGHEALTASLRPAFEQAAAAHSDELQIDDEQLDEMLQRAAARADGLQWRRALAGVASEELGIGLAEALEHPAVARAHAIVGAPAYEPELAQIAPPGEQTSVSAASVAVSHPIRLTAIHVSGVAALASTEGELELRFSAYGLEVAGGSDQASRARLPWNEIHGLDVPEPTGLGRLRRRQGAQLVVRGRRRDARFEIPGASPEQVRAELAPLREQI
jgi:hypothetical protein